MSRDITVDSQDVTRPRLPNPNEPGLPIFPFRNPGLNPGFGGMSIYFNDNAKLQLLAKKTNFDEPLYHVVTTDAFECYMRPYFHKLPRKVPRRKIIDVYRSSKNSLKQTLARFDGRVAVSCDLWAGFGGDDHFVCVTCHWVDDGWILEERVIGFEILYPYDHVDVVSKMMEVLDEFGLKRKVGSFSFDDGVSKEKCMEHLGDGFDPIMLEFCHDRSFANAIDVCAQLFVDQVAKFINLIKELVRWFRSSPDKKREFKTLVKNSGMSVPPTRFYLDFSKNWKSTHDFLEWINLLDEVLVKLYDPVGHSEWSAIFHILCVLETFDESPSTWCHHASCHLVVYGCIDIAKTFKEFEKDRQIGSAVRIIRSKWIEVFPEIPTVYCVAAILDPRIKLEGLRKLLSIYYESLGVSYNVDEKVAKCKNALQQLHAHYAPPQETKEASRSSLEFDVFKNVLKRKMGDDEEKNGDLGEYLFFDFEFDDNDDNDKWFDLLKWWEKRKELFPVLSKVAKHVLCTPISTTIPESTRCPGRRVLDEKRSKLRQDLIKICICKKDWDSAEEYDSVPYDDEDHRDSSDSEADD